MIPLSYEIISYRIGKKKAEKEAGQVPNNK
jgi:hypothetical protein